MRKHSPCMSSDMGARGRAGIGMTLMASSSPMISANRSAIRPGVGEPGRRVRKDVFQGGVVVHLDMVVVVFDVRDLPLKMSMASERSTDGEKKRCLERSPS